MMLEKMLFKRKHVLYLLSLSLLTVSCGGDDSDPKPDVVDTTPTAVDDTLTVDENSTTGTANQVTVSTNDAIGDNGGDGNDYSLLSAPSNGSATEVSDGVFEYVPNADYSGSDSFTYEIEDEDGDKDSATVSITVNAIDNGNEPTAEDFNNIDPSLPSFVSINNTTPEGMQWVKLESMSDEFDAWDSSKWFKSTWPYGPPVAMSDGNDNSGVKDGYLWIKPTLRDDSNDPVDMKRWFQSARIHSFAETSYPMYTESRIRTNNISTYNTYWLNNGDIENRDEIDIIENNANPSCTGCTADNFPNQMNSQYFQADENKTPQTIRNKGNFDRSGLSDANPLKNVSWNEDYHTFGVWWKDAKNIQFYLDGEPAGSVVVGEHQDGNTYTGRDFTRELEIIFDVWTNEAGWLGGLPQKSELSDDSKNTMRIDWVRTWKLESN